jgi:type I restriction enzyme S subunit
VNFSEGTETMAEQKYTINDIIETYISGDWGNDEPTEDASCPVSCIRGADIVPIYNSEYSNIPLRYISEKSLSNRALQEGDIVIEKSGGSPTQSTGRVVYISKDLLDEKQDIVCSNFCAAFRIKPEWDAKYVYYYLQHIYNADVFFNFEGKTSGLKNLIMDTAFKSITIKKIAIETQRSIATVLSTIESKMAANRAINHYLEAMAKQLYDYWFVQFDFPDENGRPYKSSGGRMVWNDKLKREIPENWANATVENIEKNIITGKTPSTVIEDNFGGPIPFVTINDIRGSLHVYETARTLTTKGADSQKTKYLPKGSLCCSCIGTVGVLGFIGDIAQTNQQINSIVFSKSYNKEYMYYSLQQHFRYSSAKTGNTILNMSKDEFAKIMIIYPESSILQKYHNQCEPIFSQIDENIKELNLLTKQRNELLPLLMNGHVRIKQLNNDLANG